MATISVRIQGAGAAARRFFGASSRLDRQLQETLSELGQDAELIYASHAPRGPSGRLSRGIKAFAHGGRVIIRADAKNPLSGYDYVGVTRFGHRMAKIVPRHDRAPASVIAKHKRGDKNVERASGATGSLRFVIGGRVLYRKSVPGYKPKFDWADKARPEVEREAHAATTRLGRRIEALTG